MKKFFLPVAVVIALALASCSKKDIGINGNPGTDTTGTGTGGGGSVVIGKDSVVTFTDVKFALAPGNNDYGRVFSSVTGMTYLDDNIPDSVGKYINLALHYQGLPSIFFSSADPNNFDINIPGTTKTTVRNYVDSTFLVSSFDTLTHASTLSKLTVLDDNNSFASTDLPVVVFFKNSNGKTGIVKVKSLANEYLLVDVKVAY